jgi:hypothetical protein
VTHREVTEDEGFEVGLLLAESFEVLDESRELGRGSEVVLRQSVLPFLLLVIDVAVAVGLLLLDFGHVQLGLLEPDLAEVRLLGWDLQREERKTERVSEELLTGPRRMGRTNLACRTATLLSSLDPSVDAVGHALLAARVTAGEEDGTLHL